MTRRGDEDRTIRYLLDELTPAERDAFEEEYLADDAAYGELLAAEDDLIDRYCDDALPPERRERFEQRYLTTGEGRERVAFARALKRLRETERAPAPPARDRSTRRFAAWLPWAAMVVAVLSALLLARQIGEARRARAERASLQRQVAQQEERAREQDRRLAAMDEERKRAREQADTLAELLGVPAGSAVRTATLALAGGLRRAGTALARLPLAPGVDVVRLQLAAPQSGAPYRASLQTPEGRELWSRDGLHAAAVGEGQTVTFAVPAALLRPGHYVVTLASPESARRGESDAEFVFEVTRAP